jgi:phosphoribosylformylglycinamidine synthase subunit PurL
MIGVLDDIDRHLTMGFKSTGDAIVLLGRNTDELGGSEYLSVVHGVVAGDAPAVDLEGERRLQELVLDLNGRGLLRSAHDCAEGGLAVCLAESAMAGDGRFGIRVEVRDALPLAPLLFGEAQGRIVVSCPPSDADAVVAAAGAAGVPAAVLGTVGEADGAFVIRAGDATLDLPVASLHEVYFTAIPRLMERTAAE